jgi:hypothetical protein
MSGQRRLLREGNHTPTVLGSKMNFGFIALLLLAACGRRHPEVPRHPTSIRGRPIGRSRVK